MHSSMNALVTAASVAHSASLNRVFWNLISSLPNAVRSFTYFNVTSTAASMPATEQTPMIRRSCGSWCMSWTNPRPSWSPSRFATGTRTSSKNNSAVSCPFMPTLSSTRPRRMSFSTTISEIPWAPCAGSVLATTITRSACTPFVMNVFDPLMTYSSPSLIAFVRMPCRSEPAPGSVMAIAPTYSPDASLGSQRCFCSCEP